MLLLHPLPPLGWGCWWCPRCRCRCHGGGGGASAAATAPAVVGAAVVVVGWCQRCPAVVIALLRRWWWWYPPVAVVAAAVMVVVVMVVVVCGLAHLLTWHPCCLSLCSLPPPFLSLLTPIPPCNNPGRLPGCPSFVVGVGAGREMPAVVFGRVSNSDLFRS